MSMRVKIQKLQSSQTRQTRVNQPAFTAHLVHRKAILSSDNTPASQYLVQKFNQSSTPLYGQMSDWQLKAAKTRRPTLSHSSHLVEEASTQNKARLTRNF